MSQKRRTTKRIAVTPDTHEQISRVQRGSGMSHDEIVSTLLMVVKESGESLEQLGYRLRGITLMQPPSDTLE